MVILDSFMMSSDETTNNQKSSSSCPASFDPSCPGNTHRPGPMSDAALRPLSSTTNATIRRSNMNATKEEEQFSSTSSSPPPAPSAPSAAISAPPDDPPDVPTALNQSPLPPSDRHFLDRSDRSITSLLSANTNVTTSSKSSIGLGGKGGGISKSSKRSNNNNSNNNNNNNNTILRPRKYNSPSIAKRYAASAASSSSVVSSSSKNNNKNNHSILNNQHGYTPTTTTPTTTRTTTYVKDSNHAHKGVLLQPLGDLSTTIHSHQSHLSHQSNFNYSSNYHHQHDMNSVCNDSIKSSTTVNTNATTATNFHTSSSSIKSNTHFNNHHHHHHHTFTHYHTSKSNNNNHRTENNLNNLQSYHYPNNTQHHNIPKPREPISSCPLLCVFYAEFDDIIGPTICYQSPSGFMDSDINISMEEMDVILEKGFQKHHDGREKFDHDHHECDDDDDHGDDNDKDQDVKCNVDNDDVNDDGEESEAMKNNDQNDGSINEALNENEQDVSKVKPPQQNSSSPTTSTTTTSTTTTTTTPSYSIFDSTSEYIITGHEMLTGQILSLSTHNMHVLSFPIIIRNTKRYNRNSLLFSVGFVIRRLFDPKPFRPLLSKLANQFHIMELESQFLSSEVTRKKIQTILDGVLYSLNSPSSECHLLLDDANILHLQYFPPPKVQGPPVPDYVVPVLLRKASQLQSLDWDLTINWIVPHIDGKKYVKLIAESSEVDAEVVRACFRVLRHHQAVACVDIFRYENVYVSTAKAQRMLAKGVDIGLFSGGNDHDDDNDDDEGDGKDSNRNYIDDHMVALLRQAYEFVMKSTSSNGNGNGNGNGNTSGGGSGVSSDSRRTNNNHHHHHNHHNGKRIGETGGDDASSSVVELGSNVPTSVGMAHSPSTLIAPVHHHSDSPISTSLSNTPTTTTTTFAHHPPPLSTSYHTDSNSGTNMIGGELLQPQQSKQQNLDRDKIEKQMYKRSMMKALAVLYVSCQENITFGDIWMKKLRCGPENTQPVSHDDPIPTDDLPSDKDDESDKKSVKSRSSSMCSFGSSIHGGLQQINTKTDIEIDWKEAFEKFDHIRFVTFGVIHGLIQRLHEYPIAFDRLKDARKEEEEEDTMLTSPADSRAFEIASLMDGKRCDDELSCIFQQPISKLKEVVISKANKEVSSLFQR